MNRFSGFWRKQRPKWKGPALLVCLVSSLWLVTTFAYETTYAQNPQQETSTATASQTTSPLPTATQTPTPTITQTASQTPTVTPTALPNRLLCFNSSIQNDGGLLLAWQMSTVDEVADFRLSRATVRGEGVQTPPIESSLLLPPIPPAVAQPIQSTIRYTTTDSGAVTGTGYVYQLEVIGNDGAVLDSRQTDSPPAGAVADPKICDPTNTQPTATPTATWTPVIFPTSTGTATRLPTPTWTATPTVTFTPSWTPTSPPADTATPLPTGTFTPTPTDTPIPATETPSPTFTVTPTSTPNILPPTAEIGDNPPPGQNPPPDIAVETPTPESASEPSQEPILPAQEEPEPAAAPFSLPLDNTTETDPQTVGARAAQEESLAEADAAIADTAIAAAARSDVEVSDFQPRLLSQSRATLFRYAFFGLAGLAFLSAFGFLLAGIGLGKRE